MENRLGVDEWMFPPTRPIKNVKETSSYEVNNILSKYLGDITLENTTKPAFPTTRVDERLRRFFMLPSSKTSDELEEESKKAQEDKQQEKELEEVRVAQRVVDVEKQKKLDEFNEILSKFTMEWEGQLQHADYLLETMYDEEEEYTDADREGLARVYTDLKEHFEPAIETVIVPALDTVMEELSEEQREDVRSRVQQLSAHVHDTLNSIESSSTGTSTTSPPPDAVFAGDEESLKQLADSQFITPELNTSTVQYGREISGMDEEFRVILSSFILPLIYPGIKSAGKNLLLWGPPGTGKSFLVEGLANMFRQQMAIANGGKLDHPEIYSLFSTDASAIKSKFLGASETRIKLMYKYLQKITENNVQEFHDESARSILFIDEADSIVAQRGGEADSGGTVTAIVNTFLPILQSSDDETKNRVLTVMATNNPWTIDDAIKRRFSSIVFVDLPLPATMKKIILSGLERAFKKGNKHDDETFEEASTKFDKLTEEANIDENLKTKAALFGAIKTATDSVVSKFSFNTAKAGEELTALVVANGSFDISEIEQEIAKHAPVETGKWAFGVSASDLSNYVKKVINKLGDIRLSTPYENTDGTKCILSYQHESQRNNCINSCKENLKSSENSVCGDVDNDTIESACNICAGVDIEARKQVSFPYKWLIDMNISTIMDEVADNFTTSVNSSVYADMLMYKVMNKVPKKRP